MVTGDVSDFIRRLQGVLPRWFPDPTAAPVLYGILQGVSVAMAQCYALLAYVRLQTRLQSSSDGWVDLASADYFGNSLPRKSSEADASFIARIMANLFPEKGTRNAMVRALTTLTGTAPTIFEPARPQDAFCLGRSGLGTGRLGSYVMNNQAFITVYLPASNGGALIAGLGSTYAGLGSSYLAMADAENLYNVIAHADVYAIIEATKPLASTMWTAIATQ